ncbi:MAG: DMT family transporter [Paracoccaceae bacterium]
MSAKDWVLLLVLSLLWGGSFFFNSLALQGLPVMTIVWCRVALGALLLWTALRVSGRALPQGRAVWGALLVMGFLNNAVPFTLFVLAQGQITGSLAAILNATTPLFTVLVAHVATTDERIGPAKLAGLALGFGGVVVMMSGAEATGDIWAKLACLAAALSYGLAGVWGRRFRRMGVEPLQTAFGQVAASSLLIAPIWLFVDQPWSLPAPGLTPVLAILGIASLSTALAYLIYFRILASAGATRLALVTFLIPVSATLLGVGLLGEVLRLEHLAGFVMIAAGLAAIDGRVFRRRVAKG